MTERALSLEQWFELRNCVMEAVFTDQFRPAGREAGHAEIVSLVRAYLETKDEATINRAARMVAALKPGISQAVAQSEPWLVLEKS